MSQALRNLQHANERYEEERRLSKTIFPVEHPSLLSLTEAQMICPGYGSPENGFTCGREKDYDREWCDNCQDSADLDQGMEDTLEMKGAVNE